MNPLQVRQKLWEVAGALQSMCDEIYGDIGNAGRAEWEYRQAKATARAEIKRGSDRKLTVADLDAEVDKACADQQLEAFLARDRREVFREALRARQSVLSSLQTLNKGFETEAGLDRQDMGRTA